ncbi:TPA: hypothetical protein HA246_04425 [Candidatus Woesearchaeota archaeon]|nr:hypothetical protein [Candidatus Woesearchaeota archaeon]
MRKQNHLQKRGQITVFIIIGVIVLFSTGTIFYIRSQITEQKISTEKEPVIREVPGQVKVVSQFVEACIKQKAVEGLAALGEHGGYVDLDSGYMQENNILFKQQLFAPTESDYVDLFENSNANIPYWYYLKSKNKFVNTCEYASNKPKLKKSGTAKSPYYSKDAAAIDAQLENFIITGVNACVGDFSELKERGYDVERAGEIKVQTTVADQDVRFLVQMPLKINYQGSVTEINEFYIKIPLKLKKMYEISQALVEAQITYNFMSRITTSLIGSYVGMDENKLMPLAESQYGGTPKFWTKTQMRETFETVLSTYTKLWQVQGSKNFQAARVNATQRYSASIKRLHDNMVLPELPGVTGFSEFGIYFDYLGWPIYFNVNCKGELCRSEELKSIIPMPAPLTVHRYNAQYDISYPVVVQIVHPPTLEFTNGYVFRFAMEDNVRTNEAFDCNVPIVEIPSDNSQETLLCNPNQRLSGNITLKVVDKVEPSKPVDDVNIDLDLAGEVCTIGQTNNKGILKQRMPLGAGALLTAQKFGYITQSKLLNIEKDKAQTIELEFSPIKEVNVDVKRIKLDANLQPLDQGKPLDKSQEVALTFTRISKDPLEEEFTSVVHYNANSTDNPKLRIAPGEYDLIGQLLVNNKTIVPQTKKKVKTGLISKKTITIPGTTLKSPHIWGGIDTRLKIPDNILRRDSLTFYVFELAEPGSIEHLSWLGQIGDISAVNKALIIPK